mgnify:CR=1 FL=1
MRAAVHTRFGPPEVLRVMDVEKPVPRDNEILIKVHASTVNRSDCGFRSASPWIVRLFAGLSKPRRPISGTEFAGEIEQIGRGVTLFKVGDAVFGRAQDETPGSHAQYMCMPQDGAVAHKPRNLTFAEAAVICDGAMLAGMWIRRVDFNRHKKVLVNGASGAIGSACLQLAKVHKAHVTAVCKTEAIDIVRSLGADRVIDYKKEDFTTLDESFDVVFDAVGKSSLTRCRHLIRSGGIYVSSELGPMLQNPIQALRTALFGGKIKVYFPIPRYRKEEVVYLKGLVESGRFRPVIDRTYPLDQIVQATRFVETGEKIGNVVILVTQNQPARP